MKESCGELKMLPVRALRILLEGLAERLVRLADSLTALDQYEPYVEFASPEAPDPFATASLARSLGHRADTVPTLERPLY